MKSITRLITCSALALGVAATIAIAGSPTTSEARKAARQLGKSDKSLAQIIRAAEKETDGKAVSVDLVESREWQIIKRNWQQTNGSWRDNNTNRAGDPAGETSTSSYQHNRSMASNPRKIDFRVTCLVGNAKLRDVYVCPLSGKILTVSSTSRYGGDEYEYRQNPYPNNRRAPQYNRYDGRPDNRGNDSHIEQNAWPPTVGERYYQDYQDGRRRAQIYNDAHQNDRRSYEESKYGNERVRYDNYRNDVPYQEGAARTASRSNTYASPGYCQLGSFILNESAVDLAGQDLGDVEDIAIDPATGKIVYLALARGGFLGGNAKLFAIPSETIIDSGGKHIRLDIRKEELRDDACFENDAWPLQAEARLTTSNDNPSVAKIVRVSTMIGRILSSDAEDKLGAIDDVVIDMDRQKVAFLLTNTERGLIAVPANAVEHKNDRCLVAMGKTRFDQQPAFRDVDYPIWSSELWSARVHRAFEVSPYWERTHQDLTDGAKATATPDSTDKVVVSNEN